MSTKNLTKINVSIFDDDDLYNFILISNEGKFSNIKALFPKINHNKELKNKNPKKIQYEEFNLNKKDIERNIKLIDGIIFIYHNENIEILNNIIDYFQNFDKKSKKEKPIPKIILGNKNEIINSLNNSKEQKILEKIKYLKYLEPEIKEQNEINLAIEEFIKIKKIYNKYDNFINENKINEKQVINSFGKSKMNISKCFNCNQIFQISINHYSNYIYLYCPKCKQEKKIEINDYEKFKSTLNCCLCNKIFNITNSNNYCFNCKKFICNNCIKNHIQKEETDNPKYIPALYQSNFVDIICNIHNKLCYNYCLDCKINICIECELEYHLEHKTQIFDDTSINEIISKQKKYLLIEKQKNKRIKELIEDCLKELKKFFDNLIIDKEKTLNIIEEIIKECEVYRYDNILLENIKNLNLEDSKSIIYSKKNNCLRKLNDLFEFFNVPIKLENTKLCIENNFKGPFDSLKQIKINDKKNDRNEIIENITDLCPLFDYKGKNYFAVSYNNGLLKIYNDDFENRIPVKIIKEFGEREGINSLYKSDTKSLYLVGYSKIKKLLFLEGLNEYKVINEIKMENQLFKTIIEMQIFDALIVTTNSNNLLCINSKTGNLKSDMTQNIDTKEKELLYINKINDNKIIILFNELNDFKINLERNTILNDMDIDNSILSNKDSHSIDDLVNDTLMSNIEIYNQKESSYIYWKILEINLGENNNIEVKKTFLFANDINYLGNLDEQLILLFNKQINKLIIFDTISYYNIVEMPFNLFYKPIISFTLNKRKSILDLLVLCEKGNINQYSLNLKIGLIYPIGRVKIIQQNNKDDNLFNLFDSIKMGNNLSKNDIVKIINYNSNDFIFITDDYSVYYLKNINNIKI